MGGSLVSNWSPSSSVSSSSSLILLALLSTTAFGGTPIDKRFTNGDGAKPAHPEKTYKHHTTLGHPIVVPASEVEGHAVLFQPVDDPMLIGVIQHVGVFVFAEVVRSDPITKKPKKRNAPPSDDDVYCGQFQSLKFSVQKCTGEGLFLLSQDFLEFKYAPLYMMAEPEKAKIEAKKFENKKDKENIVVCSDEDVSTFVKFKGSALVLYRDASMPNQYKVGTYFEAEKIIVAPSANGIVTQHSYAWYNKNQKQIRVMAVCARFYPSQILEEYKFNAKN